MSARAETMLITARVMAGVMVLMGTVWTLQGLNVLGGSFMSGESFWAGAGLAFLIAGLVLGAASMVRRKS